MGESGSPLGGCVRALCDVWWAANRTGQPSNRMEVHATAPGCAWDGSRVPEGIIPFAF